MKTGIKQRIAGVAVAGTAVLATGFATAPAQAQAPTHASAAASLAAHRCPHGAICVHGYKYSHGQRKYSWRNYWSCANHGPWPSWYPTYYINNQSHGTVARFKNKQKHTIQKTPGAYSKGKVNSPFATYYVDPC